jgi:hypothetical protein
MFDRPSGLTGLCYGSLVELILAEAIAAIDFTPSFCYLYDDKSLPACKWTALFDIISNFTIKLRHQPNNAASSYRLDYGAGHAFCKRCRCPDVYSSIITICRDRDSA